MDTIGRPLLSSSFQEGSTVLWFGFIVLSRTTLLPFSLLVRKQTLTSVGSNCCRAIHTCPHASLLPGGTQVLLRYLLFPLCHARKREGMWDVVGGGSSYNSGSHSVPFSEGLPTAILLKHFIKIHLFFFYIH